MIPHRIRRKRVHPRESADGLASDGAGNRLLAPFSALGGVYWEFSYGLSLAACCAPSAGVDGAPAMFQFETAQRKSEVVAAAAAGRAARFWARLIEVARDGGTAQMREQ
jgi:hypothetical protein